MIILNSCATKTIKTQDFIRICIIKSDAEYNCIFIMISLFLMNPKAIPISFNSITNAFTNLKMFINLGLVLLSISFYHPLVVRFYLDPFWNRRRYKDKLINFTFQNTENTFVLLFSLPQNLGQCILENLGFDHLRK